MRHRTFVFFYFSIFSLAAVKLDPLSLKTKTTVSNWRRDHMQTSLTLILSYGLLQHRCPSRYVSSFLPRPAMYSRSLRCWKTKLMEDIVINTYLTGCAAALIRSVGNLPAPNV